MRVALGSDAEPRSGSHEETRYVFTRSLDRYAVWIAATAPVVATLLILIAR